MEPRDQFKVSDVPVLPPLLAAKVWGCSMNMYVVPEPLLTRLSELDSDADHLRTQCVTCLSIGGTLMVEPVFMGLKRAGDIPAFAGLVAWVFGPAIFIYGFVALFRYIKRNRAAKSHLAKITSEERKVPSEVVVTADHLRGHTPAPANG